MKIYFSNSDYLRNFDRFLSAADLAGPEALSISTHPKWVSVHPAVLTLAAVLAMRAGRANVHFGPLTKNCNAEVRAIVRIIFDYMQKSIDELGG